MPGLLGAAMRLPWSRSPAPEEAAPANPLLTWRGPENVHRLETWARCPEASLEPSPRAGARSLGVGTTPDPAL